MLVLDKGYLTYYLSETENLTVGIITKELDMEDMWTYYCLYVDMNRYYELEKFGLNPYEDDNLITGVFLEGRTYIKFKKIPYLIWQRTADRRRPDIDEILKRRGLKTYNQFKLCLATEGRYLLDNWRFFKEPKNSIDCDKEIDVQSEES